MVPRITGMQRLQSMPLKQVNISICKTCIIDHSEGRAMVTAVEKAKQNSRSVVNNDPAPLDMLQSLSGMVVSGSWRLYMDYPVTIRNEKEMPVPATLIYNKNGSEVHLRYFIQKKRVHPQVGYDRPGWLRCEQFGAVPWSPDGCSSYRFCPLGYGYRTYTGPPWDMGHADFPKSGLWNVHGIFTTEALYENGVHMIVSNEHPMESGFEGTEGWIWVTRGSYRATASDPVNADGIRNHWMQAILKSSLQ